MTEKMKKGIFTITSVFLNFVYKESLYFRNLRKIEAHKSYI
jgi:hypothetical protein